MRLPDRSRPDRSPDGEATGSRSESLGEVLAWLDRHINLEAIERGVAGRAAEPTLERIAALTAAMGDPERSFPCIHVTGTNGKTSTTRLCTALVMAQGLSVGTYTSPHLVSLNERIAWNGEPIGDDDLFDVLSPLGALEEFIRAENPGMLAPTWFELMTAAAYRFFADVAVEAGVIEVGLGGRYDATNVADGVVAVATNVELDHVSILGGTRAKIAWEKSGIVKPGCVAVVGDEDDDIVAVFEDEARRVGAAAFWRRGVEFDCVGNFAAHGGRVVSVRTPGATYEDLFVPLYGAHQGDNVAIAIAAAEAFFGVPLDASVVAEALGSVRVPGRLEVLGRRPLVVLDGAHNPAGAAALGAALDEDFGVVRRTVLVFGCLNGRSPGDVLAALGPDRIVHVVVCTPPSLRGVPAADVAAAAAALGLEASVADSVPEALAAARGLVSADDLVLVTGSLYLVGAARRHLTR
ncbi:MAG: bifunctional folylpolyglutamate synthase/dihydrofolate synthase [Acidimicrobiales bacterium]